MSRQFQVTLVIVTLSEAKALGHDGKLFVNEDFPAGSLLAFDTKGDVFTPRQDVVSIFDSDWTSPKQGPMCLFRDYWHFVMTREEWEQTDPRKVSPYNASIRAADGATKWVMRK